jgi:hypothetical protein
MCLYPDELDVPDFDHVRAFTYGSSFLMLYGAMDGDETGCNEIRLAGSPDGLRWTAYYTREPFLKRGPEGTWDHGSVRPSCPPVRQDGRLLLYYSGATLGQHQAGTCLTGVGVAVMSPDRFVEQRAGEQAGYLLTKEIVMQGNRLRLNTVPDPRPGCNPELKVEIAQRPPAGRALDGQHAWPGFSLAECDPVRLGGTDAAVTWRQSPDISALAGKPVYLRFALRSAGLFAFRVDRE